MNKRVSLNWQQILLAAGAILACALLFWNPHSQSSSWIFPYFSGAANLGSDLAWRVDVNGFAQFATLPYSEQMNFRFGRVDLPNLAAYSVLDKGYIYVIWLAQTIMFWLPQIKAVIWLQIVFHILSSLWVICWLSSRRQQVIFLLAYAANPIVLHFVTFAYHYYWQVIPSLAWFWYESREGASSGRRIGLLALVLAAAFLIRQSTVIVSLLILVYAAWRNRTVIGWAAVVCFLAFVMIAKNPSQPWHTAYVGIGAYPNAAGIALDDESGYKLFKESTGIRINTAPPDGNYYDEQVRGRYYGVLKERIVEYAAEHPVQLAKNAALNVLQGYSVGYPVGQHLLAYASAFIGMVFLLALLLHRMYLISALILAGVAGFVAYYPPIPAYMFGNYLLLSLGLAGIVDQICQPDGRIAALGRSLKERLFRLP